MIFYVLSVSVISRDIFFFTIEEELYLTPNEWKKGCLYISYATQKLGLYNKDKLGLKYQLWRVSEAMV